MPIDLRGLTSYADKPKIIAVNVLLRRSNE
jgi:hypothetical protein